MTKAELIGAVAEQAGMTKKDSEKAVTAVIDVITAALVKGDKVSLVGFRHLRGSRTAAPATHQPQNQGSPCRFPPAAACLQSR